MCRTKMEMVSTYTLNTRARKLVLTAHEANEGIAYRSNHNQGVGNCHEKLGTKSFRVRAPGHDQRG